MEIEYIDYKMLRYIKEHPGSNGRQRIDASSKYTERRARDLIEAGYVRAEFERRLVGAIKSKSPNTSTPTLAEKATDVLHIAPEGEKQRMIILFELSVRFGMIGLNFWFPLSSQ